MCFDATCTFHVSVKWVGMDSNISEEEGTKGSTLGRREFLIRLMQATPMLVVGSSWSSYGQVAKPAKNDLSFLRDDLEVHPRAEWTAERPRLARLTAASPYTRVTVHHQGMGVNGSVHCDDVVSDIHNVLDGHFQRRFGDIGYHMIIDQVGRVWEGRSLRYMGAHVADNNEGNIGVMLLGNFEKQKPTDKQLMTLRAVIDAIQTEFLIPFSRVYGHRDLGQTLCPGRHLLSYVHLIQRNGPV